MSQIANGDLVVIIPGILGSTLSRNSKQTWGYRQVIFNLHRIASKLTDDLTLPAEAFSQINEGYDDGTKVTGTLKTLGIIPGVWSLDGYDEILSKLHAWFSESKKDIYEFPYDWRQSNEFTARRLQQFVEPLLHSRRESVPDAKLILIGHSMGGLVAQFYAECLDTQQLTRRVITIGTPYSGAVKALLVLANGFARVGLLRIQLGDLARSLPSVAELMPAYEYLRDLNGGSLPYAQHSAIATLPPTSVDRFISFHTKLKSSIALSGKERPSYHALLSYRQKTDTWASINASGELIGIASNDVENAGDGTVPRCSAVPPEWPDDSQAKFVAGKHASLQSQHEALSQLRGILTSRPRRPQAVTDEIAVDAPSIAMVGEDWIVDVYAIQGTASLPLKLAIINPDDSKHDLDTDTLVHPTGGGHYTAHIPMRRAGLFRWIVYTPMTAAVAVDPISDILLCIDDL